MENNKNKNQKFHGLSSPQELIEMWRELRYDDDDDDINVIWDYMEPEDLKPGFNIVNIKYNPKAPTETGHYVLISVLPKDKPEEIEYFNPVAAHTKDDEDKLNDILNFAEEHDLESNVDLSGKQTETSENCGFHCLTHAYNLYKKMESYLESPGSKKAKPDLVVNSKRMESDFENDLKKEETQALRRPNDEKKEGGAPRKTGTEDKMDVLIKAVRGIYYGLKYGFDKPSAPRKNKGSGLADYGKNEYSFSELRREIEKD